MWEAGAKGNEIIERLVKLVAHAFCSDEEIAVVEALLHHGKPLPALSRGGYVGPDLRKFVRVREQQQIHDILSRLKRNNIVCCMEKMIEMTDDEKRHYERMNVRQLSKRQTLDKKPMTFWFIDFKGFFEQTLYKVDMMRSKLDEQVDELRNSQAYYCPDVNCGMVYDINDFGKLDRLESGGFQCGQCQAHELAIRDNKVEMDQARVARANLDHQLAPILEILDNGSKLCYTRNAAIIDNSMDVMTREQYNAERASSVMAGGSSVGGNVPYAQLEVEVELEGDEEQQAKRRRLLHQEGDRLNREKMPPWLREKPDTSYAAGLPLPLSSSGGGGAPGRSMLETRALQRHNVTARRQRTATAKPTALKPPLDRNVYEYYVDLLGLRDRLADEERRAQEQEFIPLAEYLKNPYLPAATQGPSGEG